MKKLLLTLDYELYGDGSGDVFKHIVEPTNSILDVVERFGAKITVFFDVVEYWRLRQEWESGNDMGYESDPVKAMEQQILDIIARGHDVQLHIHPQWVDAKWEGDHWTVEYDNWRLSTFTSPTMDINGLIAKGKSILEELIKPSFPEYECRAIRAGGYNAQPSKSIVDTMRVLGLRIDSSVVPGAKEDGTLSIYDYSALPLDLGQWNVEDKLETPSSIKSDIVELPVVSFPIMRLLKFLSWTRINSILKNRSSAQASFAAKTTKVGESSGVIKKLSYFFKKEYQTWDYCLFPNWLHYYFLHKISKQKERDTFVVIGHPKSLVSTKSLEFLLKKTEGHMNFVTMSEML